MSRHFGTPPPPPSANSMYNRPPPLHELICALSSSFSFQPMLHPASRPASPCWLTPVMQGRAGCAPQPVRCEVDLQTPRPVDLSHPPSTLRSPRIPKFTQRGGRPSLPPPGCVSERLCDLSIRPPCPDLPQQGATFDLTPLTLSRLRNGKIGGKSAHKIRPPSLRSEMCV